MRSFLLTSALLASLPAQVLAPRLVTDINRQPLPNGSAWPAAFRTGNGRTWFTADHPLHGRELFSTLGTPSSTRLALDLEPGQAGSDAEVLGFLGSRLLLLLRQGNGWFLGSSDGTAAGTRKLQTAGAWPVHEAVILGGRAIVSAWDPLAGQEPWVTDGVQIARLADLRPGPLDSSPAQFTRAGTRCFFVAETPATGSELHVTDGTTAGTALVRDIFPGPIGSAPTWLCALGSKLLFTAIDPVAGREWFVSDGTAGGTTLLADLTPGSGAAGPLPLGTTGTLLFFATDDQRNGIELWVTDGSTQGTRLVLDLHPGPAGSNPRPVGISGATLYFTADDGVHGSELWRSDGTAGGTTIVADLSAPPRQTRIHGGISIGRQLVFFADEGTLGFEPWVTDGTAAGTKLLRDIHPSGGSCLSPAWALDPSGTRILFRADDGVHGAEPWVTDGTSAGTNLLEDVHAPPPGASRNGVRGIPFDWYGELYFAADDGVRGIELWRSDGTAAGTSSVADLNPGPAHGLPSGFAALPERLLFAADEGAAGRGRELFATDGTPGGTTMLRDIRPGPGSSEPSVPIVLGTMALFAAHDGGSLGVGREPWVTDGTAAGTKLLADVRPGLAGSMPDHFVRIGNRVFFSADDGVNGRELWVTFGTPASTSMAFDLQPGPGGSEPRDLVEHHGLLYFTADDGIAGAELWCSDGTRAGTRIVADLFPGRPGSNPRATASASGRLYFSAHDGSANGLWSSDGTASGTWRIAAPTEPGELMVGREFTALGRHLLFAGTDLSYPNGTGEELWITDGTPAGTRLFREFVPGPRVGGAPGGFVRTGSRFVLFSASTVDAGRELWLADRSLAQPIRLTDLNRGAADSGCFGVVSRGKLYLTADDGRVGSELWAVDDIGANSKTIGTGCSAPWRRPQLELSDPILGRIATVSLRGVEAQAPGILVAGAIRRPIQLGPGCELYVEPAGAVLIAAFTTDAAGAASSSLPIAPSLAVLRGLPFALQSLLAPTRNPLGFDTSDCVQFVIGW